MWEWFSGYKRRKENDSGDQHFLPLQHLVLGMWMDQMSIQHHTITVIPETSIWFCHHLLCNVCANIFCYFHVMSTQWMVTTIEICSFLLKKLKILAMAKLKQKVEWGSMRTCALTHTHTLYVQSVWCILSASGMRQHVSRQGRLLEDLDLYLKHTDGMLWLQGGKGAGNPNGGNDMSRGIKAKWDQREKITNSEHSAC